MGAEDWTYFVPLQDDVAAALKALRLEVFEDLVAPDQSWPEDWPRPNTVEELRTLLVREQSFTDGILDLDERLIGPGGSDEPGPSACCRSRRSVTSSGPTDPPERTSSVPTPWPGRRRTP
jgi:hypothetical protein